MNFRLEVWSKTEDVVSTLLQVRSFSKTRVIYVLQSHRKWAEFAFFQ